MCRGFGARGADFEECFEDLGLGIWGSKGTRSDGEGCGAMVSDGERCGCSAEDADPVFFRNLKKSAEI